MHSIRHNFKAATLSLLSLLTIGTTVQAATIQSKMTGGSWSAGTTWVGGVAPGAGDSVIINGTVTNDVNSSLSYAYVEVNGTLMMNNAMKIYMKSNAIFKVANGSLMSGGNGGSQIIYPNGTTTQGGFNVIGPVYLNGTTPFFISGSVALAVKLLSFNGTVKGNAVTLNWEAASEANHGYYMVEKSTNGKSFTDLGTVAPAAEGFTRTYTFTDASMDAPVSYYRLRMVAQDGSTSFSKTLSLKATGMVADQQLTAFPNPATETLHYTVTGNTSGATVILADMTGKIVWSSNIAQATNELNLRNLNSGSYRLTVIYADGAKKSLAISKQ